MAVIRPRCRSFLLGPAVVAVALVAAGCLSADTTTCGDVICPVGRACDGNRGVCVLPDQVQACATAADGAECMAQGVERGVCDHGVCHAIVCGNTRVEPGEKCDDGDTEDRDGCSADCTSTEVCGNGVIDLLLGEDCDDENFRSHDGCSSRCTLELPTWSEVSVGVPAGTIGAALAWDATRGQVVRFGGTSPTFDPDGGLLAWTGGQWLRLDGGVTPPRRHRHVLVADAGARELVLFGGEGLGGQLYGDLWRWDGHAWRELTMSGPLPRRGAAAAYDAARGEIVVFGGHTQAGPSGETWALGPALWTQKLVPGPSPRRDAVMAYDAKRERVVLFGGRDAAGAALDDTWEWTGAAWVEVTPATVPAARGAMVYDAARGAVVLFGGDLSSTSSAWSYAGGDWTLVAAGAAAPSPRTRVGLAFDPSRGRVLAFGGGFDAQLGVAYKDVWELATDGWHELTTVETPPKRVSGRMVWDGARRRMLLHGGFLPLATPRTDTWSFDGRSFAELSPVAAPPPGAANPSGMGMRGMWVNGMIADDGPAGDGAVYMVRDSLLGQMTGTLEVWRFDGGSWARVAEAGAPPTRVFAAVGWDPLRRVIVVFGGDRMMAQLAETWELDVATLTWTQKTPATSPPGRAHASVAWDAGQERLVIFGGVAAMTSLDDTWAWDGTTWTELSTAMRPPRRRGAPMVWHEARQRLLLFGGIDGAMPFTDLWEHASDGSGWSPVDVAAGPGPRETGMLAYDPVRQLAVLHGGDPQDDTWELAWRSTVEDELCAGSGPPGEPLPDRDGDGLVGCADPDCEGAVCAAGQICLGGVCGCPGGEAERACGDGVDDDCDGAVDCADDDCAGRAPCQAEAMCSAAGDDDADGRSDCADPGCAGAGVCEAFELSCGDGEDNDGDALVDCADPDCYLVACDEVTP